MGHQGPGFGWDRERRESVKADVAGVEMQLQIVIPKLAEGSLRKIIAHSTIIQPCGTTPAIYINQGNALCVNTWNSAIRLSDRCTRSETQTWL